ncbi:MAG: ATP-binding cassette domain-containing protein [Candidatus Portiera sp.]|nr:ATP-binding cassette domain-containing protein [Portiera sp.]
MLTIDNLTCTHKSDLVLKGLNLSLAKGEIGAIMGNNGVGKSTLLQAIAGFISIDQGSICFDGNILSTANWLQEPAKRSVGMVFQEMALFPHLSAEQNLIFGLQGLPTATKKERLQEISQLLHSNHLLDKYPYELSGGEQQRIAIGRTLATAKPLMLFDEPFAKLDVSLKRELSFSVREYLQQRNITAIFVSHDKTEAINMCDKLGTLEKGNLSTWQDKRELAVDMMDLLP